MLLTVRNVGRILDLYSVETPERGPTEVGAELGMGKSKAQLLMASMAEIGLLRRVAGGRYRAEWRASLSATGYATARNGAVSRTMRSSSSARHPAR